MSVTMALGSPAQFRPVEDSVSAATSAGPPESPINSVAPSHKQHPPPTCHYRFHAAGFGVYQWQVARDLLPIYSRVKRQPEVAAGVHQIGDPPIVRDRSLMSRAYAVPIRPGSLRDIARFRPPTGISHAHHRRLGRIKNVGSAPARLPPAVCNGVVISGGLAHDGNWPEQITPVGAFVELGPQRSSPSDQRVRLNGNPSARQVGGDGGGSSVWDQSNWINCGVGQSKSLSAACVHATVAGWGLARSAGTLSVSIGLILGPSSTKHRPG